MPLSESSTSQEDLISESLKHSLPSTDSTRPAPSSTESGTRTSGLEAYHRQLYDTANERLPVTVFLHDKFWFSSTVNERRARYFRFPCLAFYCRIEAKVWARIVVSAPKLPIHRCWETCRVESSPRYRACGDGFGAGGQILLPPPFDDYANCFGYFPKAFWERELLVQYLNQRGQHEYPSTEFTNLCTSVGL